MPAPQIRVWSVQITDAPLPALFDDLDTALAYIRGYIGTNGTGAGDRVSLESRLMDESVFRAQVEVEDGGTGAGARS